MYVGRNASHQTKLQPCAIHSPAQLFGTASRKNINLYCLLVALSPFTDTCSEPLQNVLRPQDVIYFLTSDQQFSDSDFCAISFRLFGHEVHQGLRPWISYSLKRPL